MTLKNILLYVMIVLFLASCGTKESIPSDMVPKEKMINILLDVHIMESKIESVRFGSRDSMQVAYLKTQKEILKKYKVDSATYYKSYDYYFERMGHMKEIYEKVAAKAKELMDKHTKSDSIKKAQGPKKPNVPVQIKLKKIEKKGKE